MMSTNPTVDVQTLYGDLQKSILNGELNRALKTTDKILKHSPHEKEAIQCKVVCFIQLGQFEDAIKAIRSNKTHSQELSFEEAYCLYRTDQIQKAYDILSSSKDTSPKIKELEAQVLYRLERYEDCLKVYREIIKFADDDYDDERETNMSAVIANIVSTHDPTRELPACREHTYELLYNSACKVAQLGEFNDAIEKLKKAEKICQEVMEEDGLSEEDIIEEVAPIRTQRAFCLQMSGHEKEAQILYNTILKQRPSNVGVSAVASNNSLVLNRDQNVFDSKKKLKYATAEGLEHKLTTKQRSVIALNQCLFALYTGQDEYCMELCDNILKHFPNSVENAIIIKAILMAKDRKLQEAIKFLLDYAITDTSAQLKIKLVAVHLLLSSGDRKGACEVLESLGDEKYKLGIVSTLITLYNADGPSSKEKAASLLKQAVDWHSKNPVGRDLSSLWYAASSYYVKKEKDPKAAVKCLEELLKLNKNDKKTLAQLIVVYSSFDQNKAMQLSELLPQGNLEVGDIEAIEGSSWSLGTKTIKKVVGKSVLSPGKSPGETPGGTKSRGKSKKKRKPKLPKNLDPDVPPDPERWLPKHERTGYKKRKDKRPNKDLGKGTQGTASGASDQYDITKMPSQNRTNVVENVRPPHPRGRVQHKKKKKGR